MKPKLSSCYVAIGSVMVLYSSAVIGAQTTLHGPTWEYIAVGAAGLVVAMLGAYIRGVSGHVVRLDEKYNELRELVLKDYHSKSDLNLILGEVKQSIARLHERFDAAGYPH